MAPRWHGDHDRHDAAPLPGPDRPVLAAHDPVEATLLDRLAAPDLQAGAEARRAWFDEQGVGVEMDAHDVDVRRA